MRLSILMLLLASTSSSLIACSASSADEQVGESADELTTRTEILCESQSNRYKSCAIDLPTNGRVVRAKLVDQFSSASCIEDRSWGWEPTYLWVHNGCRAAFEITVWSPNQPPPPPPPPASEPEIVLYQDADFGGNTRSLRASVSDFDFIGFDNKVSSIIVKSGYWQLCQHDYYEGACITYGPGKYRQVTMNDSFGSARIVNSP
jgi:hypothetical protein